MNAHIRVLSRFTGERETSPGVRCRTISSADTADYVAEKLITTHDTNGNSETTRNIHLSAV